MDDTDGEGATQSSETGGGTEERKSKRDGQRATGKKMIIIEREQKKTGRTALLRDHRDDDSIRVLDCAERYTLSAYRRRHIYACIIYSSTLRVDVQNEWVE